MVENNILYSLLLELKKSGKTCFIHHDNDGVSRHLKGIIINFDDQFIVVRRPLGDEITISRDAVTGIDKPSMGETNGV